MSPPPGTRDEYSRGDGGSRGVVGAKNTALALPLKGAAARSSRRPVRRPARQIRFSKPVAGTVMLGALTSAAVLVVAEFLTLYSVRVIRGSASVPPIAAGTENHYALIPVALLGLVLALAAIRLGDRWALVAVATLGLIALLIGLLHDLPDARRTGLVGSVHTGWDRGASSPSVGMYLETLGAVMLVLTAGLGLLFGEPVADEARSREPAPVPFGARSETSTDAAPVVAAAVAEAPGTETVPVADEPSAPPEGVGPPPPAKRPPPAPRKRSPSSGPKRSTAKGTRASSSTKRAPAGSRKRPASSPSGSGAASAGEEGTAPAASRAAKRSSAASTKRSSAGGRKQSTKRPPSNPKRGGSSTPRSKRSES